MSSLATIEKCLSCCYLTKVADKNPTNPHLFFCCFFLRAILLKTSFTRWIYETSPKDFGVAPLGVARSAKLQRHVSFKALLAVCRRTPLWPSWPNSAVFLLVSHLSASQLVAPPSPCQELAPCKRGREPGREPGHAIWIQRPINKGEGGH